MRVLITGAAGLCGTHLIDELATDNKITKIFGVENFSRGYPRREEYIIKPAWQDKYQLVDKNFQDLSVKEINNMDVDVIVHLAAFNSAKESMETPEEYFTNNDFGTLQLLEKLRRTKNNPCLIFASTIDVYGKPSITQVKGCSFLDSQNIYTATKLAGEAYCTAYYNWRNYPVVIVRLGKIYGENQNVLGYTSVISNFISKAISNEPIIIYGCGASSRDFVYVGDVARALKLIIRGHQKVCGDTLNIASGQVITIMDLAKKIIRLTESNSEIIKLPPQKGDYVAEKVNSKLKNSINWVPEVSLDEGLERTIKWHRGFRK